MIIIHGRNHYPQDIEQTVAQSHADLGTLGAAFGIERDGQTQLVVLHEVERQALQKLDAESVFSTVRAAVSRNHGLTPYAICLLEPGCLLQTTGGEVQRQTCRAAFEEQRLAPLAQWFVPQTHSGCASPGANNSNHGDAQAEALIHWLRDYARSSINSQVMDERRCLTPSVVLDFGNQGLLGMQVPKQYGGLALGHQAMLRVLEQIGAIDPTLALFVGLNNVLGIRPIQRFGQPELKERLLPQLATGRILAAFALTEPSAGSHPLATKAQAIPTAQGWQLSGQKIWSGSAAWAGVINVFVKQRDANGRLLGMTGFALEKGLPGLRQGPEALTMGMRGMVQNTVFLEQVPVDESRRLGEPGAGMTVAQDVMMYGRLAIASASVGGMKRCAQMMLRYSQRRTIATGSLLDNPVMLTRLDWLTHAIATVNGLVSFIAQQLDAEQFVPEAFYATCKIVGPELYWQAADHLVQCLGGRGYIETNIAPQILRDSRILRIFEGPTETLAMHLGARVQHQPTVIDQLFTDLGLAPLARELFDAAERITHHYSGAHSPFTKAVTARRQAHFAVGHVAAWAVVRATLTVTGAAVRAQIWAQQQFKDAVAQALAPTADSKSFSSVDLVQHIHDYRVDIGEVDQTLAGVDAALDDWLKPEVNATVPPAG
ncbi:MAG: acyl-CoA dehydrogenase family protein [Cyanobacteria bacterium P01_C01_bin.118]